MHNICSGLMFVENCQIMNTVKLKTRTAMFSTSTVSKEPASLFFYVSNMISGFSQRFLLYSPSGVQSQLGFLQTTYSGT